MRVIKGLATGIGSLPHLDADAALDLIFKYVPHSPFWPQLPKRDFREGMLTQFCENLPCLKVKNGGIFFDPQQREEELESFYERIISDDVDYFKISEDFALGLHKFYQRLKSCDLSAVEFIKIHITGPFTFLAGINDENGVMLMHDAVFRQAMLKALGMKLRWQIGLFGEFNKNIIAFIDEPYLGCFGSAYTPLNRADVVRDLGEFSQGLGDRDILLGVHCCGNTDWSIFTDIPAINVISFDAFDFQDKFVLYADNLKGFLERGGVICWGIVPTQEFSGKENAEFLINKLRQGINTLVKKGVEDKLLLESLMISPACGLGTLSPQKAEDTFRLLHEASAFIRESL